MTGPRDTPLPLSAETLALAMRAVMDVTTRERALPYIPKIVAQYATLDAARAAVPDADTRERLAEVLHNDEAWGCTNGPACLGKPHAYGEFADRILASGVLSGDAEH